MIVKAETAPTHGPHDYYCSAGCAPRSSEAFPAFDFFSSKPKTAVGSRLSLGTSDSIHTVVTLCTPFMHVYASLQAPLGLGSMLMV